MEEMNGNYRVNIPFEVGGELNKLLVLLVGHLGELLLNEIIVSSRFFFVFLIDIGFSRNALSGQFYAN